VKPPAPRFEAVAPAVCAGRSELTVSLTGRSVGSDL
jgi:hypothetical protein